MDEITTNERRRRLPSVEVLTGHPALHAAIAAYSRPLIVDAVRVVIDRQRSTILAGGDVPADAELVDLITSELRERFGEPLREVINGTGVLVHTNLGRSPLAQGAVAPVGYGTLEYDLRTGRRGKRGRLVDSLIARLAGAEAGLVVNNNAAAVYLVLTSLAAGREVVISRGELVQIGGGFRIPEILQRSGALLKEVGTTNKTTLQDYRAALSAQTAVILKVHRSNFKMTGFVGETSVRQLAEVARETTIPLVMDLGSGAVADVRRYGLPHEPTLADAIGDGADLVTASGDKLFGGPQAGLIAGRKDLVERLRQDPFYRALRPDKTVLAGLEFAARAHLDDAAEERLPLYRMLAFPLDKLRIRAESLMARLRDAGVDCRVIKTEATVGGGSLPEESFPSVGLEVHDPDGAESLSAKLRAASPPVIGIIAEDAVRLDLRTVFVEQDELLVTALIVANHR